jgi:hypothetical protein
MANVNDAWIKGWLARGLPEGEYETEILETEARADEYDTLGYDEEY